MRIIGLDLGDKKIGVSLSDPMGLTAQGLKVITSDGPSDAIEKIKTIAGEYNAEMIVVGLPRNMNGSIGPRAKKTKAFARRLAKAAGLPVETWDEWLTTAASEKFLIGADLSRAKRRKVIDKMSAVLILQGYLDNLKNKNKLGS